MAKILNFEGKGNMQEYHSCNQYYFSPLDVQENTLNCVLLYDLNEEFYRLNIYNAQDDNLFTNLFSTEGLSFNELIKVINIYKIKIPNEILEKIKNEPFNDKRKKRNKYIIPKTIFI